MKQESDIRPVDRYVIENVSEEETDVILYDLDSVEEITRETEEGEKTSYLYFAFRLKMQNSDKLEEYVENKYDYLLQDVKKFYEDKMADEVRAIRNRLLEESDKQMAFDRLGFEIPSSITMTNIVNVLKNFFNTLKNINTGDWAKYRQALRDITEQEGFPYDVVFPEKPKN